MRILFHALIFEEIWHVWDLLPLKKFDMCGIKFCHLATLLVGRLIRKSVRKRELNHHCSRQWRSKNYSWFVLSVFREISTVRHLIELNSVRFARVERRGGESQMGLSPSGKRVISLPNILPSPPFSPLFRGNDRSRGEQTLGFDTAWYIAQKKNDPRTEGSSWRF